LPLQTVPWTTTQSWFSAAPAHRSAAV
jgi:hypothetical protein